MSELDTKGNRPDLPTAAGPSRVDALRNQAWEAFVREIEDLLRTDRGKWVAYHGPEHICTAGSDAAAYEECDRQGYDRKELLVEWIYPAALETEFGGCGGMRGNDPVARKDSLRHAEA